MSDQQPRLPSGVPGGGQFAARIVPESRSVVLPEIISDDEHNADGTYEFPPPARSARQVIAFWIRCPVPDRVLKQVLYAHTRLVAARAEAAVAAEQKIFAMPYTREAARSQVVPAMPQADLRTFVRMAKMHWHAADLPEEERVKVDECVFTLDDGIQATPLTIVDFYHLEEIRSAFADNQERVLYETQIETRNAVVGPFNGVRGY